MISAKSTVYLQPTCLFLMGILMFGQSLGSTIYELILCLLQKMCSIFALPGKEAPPFQDEDDDDDD